MDSLSLGPVPANEECQQVGTPEYDPVKAKRECRAYIQQLRRIFGEEPDGAMFIISSNPHDFGSYLEVEIRYEPNSKNAVKYAFNVERLLPMSWDKEAKEALCLTTT